MNRWEILFTLVVVCSCHKGSDNNDRTINDYKGSFKSIPYTENLVKEFTPGIYEDAEIPDDIKQLAFGRIEIDFRYDGGGLNSFMPLFYYGSMNKNDGDNLKEEPKFHLAVEIGHYNVIPQPLEYLFYTISTYRKPQYCRDTNMPMISGKNYTVVIDKRPEGVVLQLKRDDHILNIFPHAFFPDSTQLFFRDVTSYIDKNKGDSLKKVLMVGKGFVGFDKGIHDFNGVVSGLRIYKYALSTANTFYEMQFVRNQVAENQQINFIARDINSSNNVFVHLTYEFWPYKYESGILLPNGAKRTGASGKRANNQLVSYVLQSSDIGFYKINLQTTDENGLVLGSTLKPFEVWVYPKDWDFKFY